MRGGISVDTPVLIGVPQATVLGPMLFLIMIRMYLNLTLSILLMIHRCIQNS